MPNNTKKNSTKINLGEICFLMKFKMADSKTMITVVVPEV